ncbi:MAG: transcription termination factor Rho [Clostridia bacterium]|nr:transcription termination factor Rho [Clostridia bacterium]
MVYTIFGKVDFMKTPTLAELYVIAKELQIPSYRKYKKDALMARIEEIKEEAAKLLPEPQTKVCGILELMPDGYGFLRDPDFVSRGNETYVSPVQIKRFCLKTGDEIQGIGRRQKDTDKFRSLIFLTSVNGGAMDQVFKRKSFEALTPIFPCEPIRLESASNNYTMRLIDLIAPIGKGQRALIVAPPKAGKTVLLKNIAASINATHGDSVKLMVLLIDERPEEVTDIQRSVHADVLYSTFDESSEHHTKIAELALSRALRLVEYGQDVIILLDSLTRLTRAYNLSMPATGKILSGGLDSAAFYKPKKFFGAARNIENGGSLTILATALTDTGSRMDDLIYEEFKGTGNCEIHLDRRLSEKRIFPAIDINKSGTRREELLMPPEKLTAMVSLRRELNAMASGHTEMTEYILNMLVSTKTNDEFVEKVNQSFYKRSKR